MGEEYSRRALLSQFLTAGNTGGAPSGESVTSDGDGKNTEAQKGNEGTPAAGEGGAQEPKIFSQADLDRIVEKRLGDEKARAQKRLDEEKKRLELERLAKEGEWEQIAKQREAELNDLKQSIRQGEIAELRQKLAAAESLPIAALKFVQGETEADIRVSIREIKSLIGKPAAPEMEGGKKAGKNGAVTEEERRKGERAYARSF